MTRKNQKGKPLPTTLKAAIWQHYKYFLLVWVVLNAIVLYCYQTQFDRERICTYQYCPSNWALVACTTCLVLALVWVDFFFNVLRPYLQLKVGKLVGTRVKSDLNDPVTAIELLVGDTGRDFWTTSPGAGVGKQLLVTAIDFSCMIFFVMLPVTAIISASAGIAYVEQQNSPTPPGLVGIKK